jgi:hypothetical protein
MVLVLLVFSLSIGAPNSGRGGHYQNRFPNYVYVLQITAGDTVLISTEGTPDTHGIISWVPKQIQFGNYALQIISVPPYSYSLEATEEDGDILIYDSGYPLSDMTINTADCLIDWLPPETHPQHHTVNGNVNDSNTTEGRTEND